MTGGGSGIGLAIAKKLASEGVKVVLFGRNQNKLQEAASSIKNAIFVQGDASKISDLDRLYKETQAKLGKIDILVASAGVAQMRHVSEVDEALFDEIVNINYKGVYFTVQRSLPLLNKGASIILISSAAAHMTWPSHSVYSSTKAAVSYLAKSLSSDLIDKGIRVNSISPGFVETPMTLRLRSTPEAAEQILGKIPANKFTTAEEIAELAFFLASSKSSYIIGADIVIDGGLSEIHPRM